MNKQKFNWQAIETVILDLDGTLIDLYFDHRFWKNIVPQAYADKFKVSVEQSRELIHRRYQQLKFSMQWYCIDFWAENLDLPLRELLQQQRDYIKVRSDVYPFLQAAHERHKKLILLTDSHPFSLQEKLKHCDLAPHFDLLLSSHQFNAPKVEQSLWHRLQQFTPFDPGRTLFIDDTEPVLDSAKQFGIAYTIGVENPDSTLADKSFARHFSIKNYRTLL
ncbi:GMP/IMP nucleotidase [Aggregatibacter actinomycetemcomitans]|uniref:GMP/IMP nucleotidase n=1 Tax=Aggregatibacter actinomycetemcomitans TaxID=714 RepID=UPI00046CF286|nr:GMP/IMP nucleotidase [Aggregatibacter actinomycetemcomitans]QPQ80587.1 GMP/IMP nucleotidase [Aggregatibacter actinomycetemcomitans]